MFFLYFLYKNYVFRIYHIKLIQIFVHIENLKRFITYFVIFLHYFVNRFTIFLLFFRLYTTFSQGYQITAFLPLLFLILRKIDNSVLDSGSWKIHEIKRCAFRNQIVQKGGRNAASLHNIIRYNRRS